MLGHPQAVCLLHVCRRPGSAHAYSLVDGSVSVSPQEPRLVDSTGLLVVPLIPKTSLILHQGWALNSSTLHEFCLLFGCESLHRFHQLLDEAPQKTVVLVSYLQAWQSIINKVRDGCLPRDRSLVGLVIASLQPTSLYFLYAG